MSAEKDQFKWKLRYGDLINAAKEMDKLWTKIKKHKNLHVEEYVDDEGDPAVDVLGTITLPIKTERLTDRASEELIRALSRCSVTPFNIHDVEIEEEYVQLPVAVYNLPMWPGFAERVEGMLEVLDLADNNDKYAEKIVKDPAIAKVLKKHVY